MITKEQLARRKMHIGSSDAAAIMGFSPWAGPAEVYASKVYELEDIATPPMERGIMLEPMILNAASEMLGKGVKSDIELVHANGIMAANLDGITEDGEIVEAKSVSEWQGWGEAGSDQVPDNYLIQVMFQIEVLRMEVLRPSGYHRINTDHAYCAAARINSHTGKLDVRIYNIPYDADIAASITEQCVEFWNKYVLTKTPPLDAPKNVETFRRIIRADGKVAEVSPELAEAYKAANVASKAAEKVLESAKAALLASIQDADTGTFNGKAVVKKINQNRFDSAAFREANPAIYEAYKAPSSYMRIQF